MQLLLLEIACDTPLPESGTDEGQHTGTKDEWGIEFTSDGLIASANTFLPFHGPLRAFLGKNLLVPFSRRNLHLRGITERTELGGFLGRRIATPTRR